MEELSGTVVSRTARILTRDPPVECRRAWLVLPSLDWQGTAPPGHPVVPRVSRATAPRTYPDTLRCQARI